MYPKSRWLAAGLCLAVASSVFLFPLLPSSGQASSESGAAPATVAANRSFGFLPPHFEPGMHDGEFVARRAGLAMTLDGAGAKVHLTRGSAEATLDLRLEGAAPR